VTIAAILIAFSLLAATGPRASDSLAVQPKRSVVISGPIASGNTEPLGAMMLDWSRAAPKQPIDLILDSPGGDIYTGFQFINVMEAVRARGTPIRCFVPTIAASMAFQILLHCSERYTLDHAWLLWHGVRTYGGDQAITASVARDLARELEIMDRAIMRELRDTLGLADPVIRFHFERETLHRGYDLAEMAPKFIRSLPAVPGLYDALNSSPRTELPDFFGASPFVPGEIVYLAPFWSHR
jgi:ATP-dependent protease ClpP protease subunit